MDPYWLEVARFVAACGDADCVVIAPREFHGSIPGVVPYERATARSLQTARFLVIHKGLIDEIPPHVLHLGLACGQVVFRNEVFLIFAFQWDAIGPNLKDLCDLSQGLASKALQAKQRTAGGANLPATDRCPPCYLGNGRAICTTIFGHRMVVDTSDLSLTPHLLTDGYWEDWVTAFIRRTVQPGWRVIEVGANFGYYTLLMADAVGSDGFVTAFEANPGLGDILSTNIKINGFRDRATAVLCAVSDRTAEDVNFVVQTRNLADSSLFERGSSAGDEARHITVKSTSLDDYFDKDHRADLIKIDAEGAEPLISKGASRLLESNSSIRLVMELNPAALQTIMDPRAFLESLQARGFEIYRIDEDSQARQKDFADLVSRWHSELYLERAT